MPTLICKYVRDDLSNICFTYNIQSAFEYYASQKASIFSVNFTLSVIKTECFTFDLALIHIHDVNYSKDVKHHLSNCTLIGDRNNKC